jgi:hypothetical protein
MRGLIVTSKNSLRAELGELRADLARLWSDQSDPPAPGNPENRGTAGEIPEFQAEIS